MVNWTALQHDGPNHLGLWLIRSSRALAAAAQVDVGQEGGGWAEASGPAVPGRSDAISAEVNMVEPFATAFAGCVFTAFAGCVPTASVAKGTALSDVFSLSP